MDGVSMAVTRSSQPDMGGATIIHRFDESAVEKPPPPPPKPAAAASGDPALAKYEKMLAMKLPQGAVEQKMRADGVDPSLLFPDAAPAPAKLVGPKPRKKTVHLQLHAGGDLMAQLKAGTKLKKVEVSAPLGPPPSKAMSSGDGGIGGLAERREYAGGIRESAPPT